MIAGLALPIVVIAIVASYFWPSTLPPLLAEPRAPVHPDLAMTPVVDVYALETETGRDELAFTATVANTGPGALLVHAVRADHRSPWRVSQRFVEGDGSISERLTEGELTFGGHGHDHWHLRAGASYTLTGRNDRTPLRIARKQGFCFFDQLPLTKQPAGAPRAPAFDKDVCDGPDRRELEMGLSSGWSDPYLWTLPDQRLDVTGLQDGTYRLFARADPDSWFVEADEDNNYVWIDIRLATSASPPRVRVLGRSAAAPSPIRP
jgi:hypothetical protein